MIRSLRFALALIVGALACSEPTPPPPPPAGDIAGRVTVEGGDLRGVIVSIPGTLSVPAADGSFAFKGLVPGTYVVSASKEGFVTASADAAVTNGKTVNVELALAAVVPDDEPPVVVSVLAVPAVIAPGATAKVTAVARDPENAALAYAWTAPEGWTISGEGAEVTVTAPSAYDEAATVTVKVTDAGGLEASGSAGVSTVANQAPIFSSLVALPNPVKPGATVTLTASAADPNGDALSYRWAVDGVDGAWTVTGEGAQVTVTAPAKYGATATAIVTADDGFGGTTSASLVLTTEGNQAPIFSSLVALPNPVRPAGSVTLTASADDPNGDALTYAWVVEGADVWLVSGSGPQVEVTAPSRYGATATARVTADDGSGRSTKASLVLTTTANQSPLVQGVTALPLQAAPGAEVTVRAVAADPDGDALTYAWVAPEGWTVNGAADADTVVLVAPAQYGASGVAKLVVSDGLAQATASVVVATRPNRAPSVASITAQPTPVFRGGTVTVDVSASDPDGDTLTYAWTAPEGWTLEGSGARVTLKAPNEYGKDGLVKVVVSDGVAPGLEARVQVSTAANRAPVVSSLVATGSPAAKGGSIALAASATDPDGDPLTYAWTVPAGWTLSGTGGRVTLKAPDTYGALGVVKVLVSDGFAPGVEAQVDVGTAANRAPVLSSLVATGSPAAKGGTITLSASASEPDGDPLTYTWTAPEGWTLTPAGATATVKAPDLQGQSALVSLVVKDGHGGEVRGQVAVATLTNRAPVIAEITSSAATTERRGTIAFSVTAFDPDGDAMTYAWKAPAGWAVAGSGKTATVTAPDAYGQSGTITVTVSDGAASQDGAVTVATRADRIPVISNVAVAPSPVMPGATATVSVSASDADGEALAYTYALDGAGWSLAGSGATVSLRAPRLNAATAKLTVTADDGYGGVATQVVTVTTGSCAANTMNCDGDAANGCEASLSSDPDNCGVCDNQCAAPTPACVASACSTMDTRSCRTIKQTVPSATDGTYRVDPDGAGGVAAFDAYCDMTTDGGGWTRCLEFVNTASEDVKDNSWFDQCVNYAGAAWAGTGVLVRLKDSGGTVRYSASGTRPSAWTNDHLTSTAQPVDQYHSGNHSRLVALTNGDKLMVTGRYSSNSGCGGSIGNGYGIVVYPASPNYYTNPKLYVFPYKMFVPPYGVGMPRDFNGWTTSTEIAFNTGATFNSCSSVGTGFLGRFELYVR